MEEILSAILILCGVEKCRESFCKKIDDAIVELCRIIDDGNEEHIAKILYILLMACQYRSTCMDFQVDSDLIFKTAMKYINSCNFLCSLRLLQLQTLQVDLKPLHSNKISLINNLSSPFHKVPFSFPNIFRCIFPIYSHLVEFFQVRLFTLQVLVKMKTHEIFETMLNVESIIPSVENYREKLNLLQNLQYNEELASSNGEDFVEIAIVKFLFGNLYINFQYLWEPTQNLIRSYLENSQSIWPTMEHQLNEAVTNTLDSVKMMENFSVNFEGIF